VKEVPPLVPLKMNLVVYVPSKAESDQIVIDLFDIRFSKINVICLDDQKAPVFKDSHAVVLWSKSKKDTDAILEKKLIENLDILSIKVFYGVKP
jgi:hypothetical protein